ncbi:MAG: DUF1585 domain-containing protein, partial [Myxococcota bacterium]
LNGVPDGSVEMLEKFADSTYVNRCFIRHVFRYFMGRNETEADACTLVAMEDAYIMSNGSFIAMLEALATSGSFLYRHDPVEEVAP